MVVYFGLIIKIFKKKLKGFTLIEFLVVIFIIGLLASVSLATVISTRDRAKDTRAVADMSQIRIEAQKYYFEQEPDSYIGFDCTNPSNMVILCADINSQVGSNPDINVTTGAYCAEVDLRGGPPNDWYCIDSIGRAGYHSSNPICDVGVFTCE